MPIRDSVSGALASVVEKLWQLEHKHWFSMIWPSDLVFEPTRPIIILKQETVTMIILNKFEDY